jgi:outer membrane protein assembly factor BamA
MHRILLISLLYAITLINQLSLLRASTEELPKIYVSSIKCFGNKTTKCSFIQNKFFLASDRELNQKTIDEAKVRLLATNLFNHIEINLKKSATKHHMDIEVIVTERNNYMVNLNGSYARRKTPYHEIATETLGIELENNNFMGKGKRIAIGGSYSHFSLFETTDTWSSFYRPQDSRGLSLEYEDPHLLGAQNYYFNLGYRYSKSRSQYFNNNTFGGYSWENDYSQSINIILGKTYSDFFYIENELYSYSVGENEFEIANLLEQNRIGYKFSWGRDNRPDSRFYLVGSNAFQLTFDFPNLFNHNLEGLEKVLSFETNFNYINVFAQYKRLLFEFRGDYRFGAYFRNYKYHQFESFNGFEPTSSKTEYQQIYLAHYITNSIRANYLSTNMNSKLYAEAGIGFRGNSYYRFNKKNFNGKSSYFELADDAALKVKLGFEYQTDWGVLNLNIPLEYVEAVKW